MTNEERTEFRDAVSKVLKNKTVAEIKESAVIMRDILENVGWEAIAWVETETEYEQIKNKGDK